jgi:hypothetical protein
MKTILGPARAILTTTMCSLLLIFTASAQATTEKPADGKSAPKIEAPVAKTETATAGSINPWLAGYLAARHICGGTACRGTGDYGQKPKERLAPPRVDSHNTFRPRSIFTPLERLPLPVHVTIGKPAPIHHR